MSAHGLLPPSWMEGSCTVLLHVSPSWGVRNINSVLETLIQHIRCKISALSPLQASTKEEVRPYHLDSILFPPPQDPSGLCWWHYEPNPLLSTLHWLIFKILIVILWDRHYYHSQFLFIYLFIYLAALGLSCGTLDLCCHVWDLSGGMRYLVPWPGIEPGPPSLGAQSHNHWTTRDVSHIIPILLFF